MADIPAASMSTSLEAAAAMEACVQHWSPHYLGASIKVDPCTDSVSFQQGFCCLVFSVRDRSPVKFVQSHALPRSFVPVCLAQQVLQCLLLCSPLLFFSFLSQRCLGAVLHSIRFFFSFSSSSLPLRPPPLATAIPAGSVSPPPPLRLSQLRRLLCLASHARFLCAALLRGAPTSRTSSPTATLGARLSSIGMAEVLMRGFACAYLNEGSLRENGWKKRRIEHGEIMKDGTI
jgi:hypothetical protein